MLESLLFIFLIFVGGIFLIISLILLLFGAVKKSSKLKKIALGIGTIPIMCIGLITFWYTIAIPSFKNNQMEDFSGAYNSYNSQLILLDDGTYKFDGMKEVGLKKSGTWKTGGIDGHFEFYDNDENYIDFASPFGGDGNEKIIFNLYESNEVRFEKIKKE